MAPNLRFTKVDEMQDELVPSEEIIKQPTVQNAEKKYDYKLQIVWRNVILMGALHLASLWSIYLIFTRCKWQTNLFSKFRADRNQQSFHPLHFDFTFSCSYYSAFVLYVFSGIGITAGAHRLWSHRSYKARLPLRIFLAFWNSVAFQVSIHLNLKRPIFDSLTIVNRISRNVTLSNLRLAIIRSSLSCQVHSFVECYVGAF